MRGQTDKTLLIKDKHSHPKYLAMWEIRSSRYARTYGEEKGKITIFLRDSFFLFTLHFFFFNLFTFTKNFVKIQFLQRKKNIRTRQFTCWCAFTKRHFFSKYLSLKNK